MVPVDYTKVLLPCCFCSCFRKWRLQWELLGRGKRRSPQQPAPGNTDGLEECLFITQSTLLFPWEKLASREFVYRYTKSICRLVSVSAASTADCPCFSPVSVLAVSVPSTDTCVGVLCFAGECTRLGFPSVTADQPPASSRDCNQRALISCAAARVSSYTPQSRPGERP